MKPGGRFAVSDVVTRGAVPEQLRRDILLWAGCIAGALEENEYRLKLAAAGFEAVSIEPTRIYKIDDAREFLSGNGVDVDAIAPAVDGQVHERVRSSQKAREGRHGRGWGVLRADLLRILRRDRRLIGSSPVQKPSLRRRRRVSGRPRHSQHSS